MRFRSKIGKQNPNFKLGMVFRTKKQLKEAVKEHKVKFGRWVKVKKTEDIRVVVKCHGQMCKWYFYSARVG